MTDLDCRLQPILAGLTRVSLVDWPGRVASVVFTRGCNFRCPWCQNPDLVNGHPGEGVAVAAVLDYLAARRKVLDGLVVTGGEPTLWPELPAFLELVREKTGLPVRLDTNGSRPDVVRALLREGLIGHLAVDYKVPFEAYVALVGARDPDAVRETLTAGLATGCAVVRTTVVPGLHTPALLQRMIDELPGLTADGHRLQPFRPGTCLDPAYNGMEAGCPEEIKRLKSMLRYGNR
ncbi:MAG: anaerobic ribonucleoside-triphosphate reductase activating protein [Bacillota bacterium]|nr:anaerobic ribonucleoside-triphosphate reductase activating protein [Bacillota bacterium]